MWPISFFKSRLAAFTQHTVRQEREQNALNYQAAKNLVDVLEMKIARLETDILTRLDDLEERVQSLEPTSNTDES